MAASHEPTGGRQATPDDAAFMQVAVALSRRGLGLSAPNPAVGVLIVRFDGLKPKIVGRGVTAQGGRPHGERIALDQAGELAMGATMYVTLEPCARRSIMRDGPSCTDAILCSGLTRVVIAARDPSPFAAGEGVRRLRSHGIAVSEHVCEAEAARINLGHRLRIVRHRPMVTVKLAQTADGFAATRSGKPLVITGPMANARTHMMRAQSDAIAVGIETVLNDDPQLTCRLPGLAQRSPIRIVFDSQLRLPQQCRLVQTAGSVPTWVFAGPDAPEARERQLVLAGVEVMRVDATADGLDLGQALRLIADRGVTRLMVEGGPTLAEALARQEMLDELVVFTGATEAGDGSPAMGPCLTTLAASLPDDEAMLGTDRMQSFHKNREAD